jgi:hypothetical protein
VVAHFLITVEKQHVFRSRPATTLPARAGFPFCLLQPVMKKVPYVELKKFLGSVFHPDWTIEHESADHAIKKFTRKADEKVKKSILADIHHLLTERSDEDLENFVCEDARGDIFPPALGFTYSDWLKHVGEMLAGPAAKKAAKKK